MSNPNAIILHGKPGETKYKHPDYPGPENANWLPWVAKQLEARGISTERPRLGGERPFDPNYRLEAGVLDGLRDDGLINRDTLVVAHSYGSRLILNWLKDNPGVAISRLVLVAPWLDPNGRYPYAEGLRPLDPEVIKRCLGGIAVLYSDIDPSVEVHDSVEMIRQAYPRASFRNLPLHGHFMIGNNMPGPEFPELLDELGVESPAE